MATIPFHILTLLRFALDENCTEIPHMLHMAFALGGPVAAGIKGWTVFNSTDTHGFIDHPMRTIGSDD